MINRIIEKIKGLDRWKKAALALTLSAALVAESHFLFGKDNKHDKVYLVDLNDKYQNELVIKDHSGKEISKYSDKKDILAIAFTKKGKKDELSEVILIDEDGNMKSGYIDGKLLNGKVLDKIEVDEEVINKLNNIGIVMPKEGTDLIETTNNNRNQKTVHLDEGENVILGNRTSISKDNSISKQDAIVLNKEKNALDKGTVTSEYIVSNSFEKIEGEHLLVNLKDAALKLREGASVKSKAIYDLVTLDEVIQIKNTPVINNESYDWFYVAAKNRETGEVITGYAAATSYANNKIENYLISSKKEVDLTPITKREYKQVDTTGAKNVKLNLRVIPNKKGQIISEIENGTIVYMKENEKKLAVDENGDRWALVYTNNGQNGYVYADYLRDVNYKPKKQSNPDSKKFGKNNTYKIDGYYGIDVNNQINLIDFEKLISGQTKLSGEASENSREYNNIKPSFVVINLGETSDIDGSILEEEGTYFYRLKNIGDMVNLCEQRKIPYGFNYKLKSTTEKEMNKEIEYILDCLNMFGSGTYNILPISVSLEKEYENDTKEHIHQTSLINKCLNTLREKTDFDAIIQMNSSNTINYDLLSKQNKENSWISEYNDKCSSLYKRSTKDYGSFIANASIRQIATNQKEGEITYNVDFINKTYYESLLEDLKLKLSQTKTM